MQTRTAQLEANHPNPNATAAAQIRAVMGARQLGRADLAAALGLSPKAAARRMRNDHDFTLNDLETIANWLEIPVETFLRPALATTDS